MTEYWGPIDRGQLFSAMISEGHKGGNEFGESALCGQTTLGKVLGSETVSNHSCSQEIPHTHHQSLASP